jgi:hypothetical protein
MREIYIGCICRDPRHIAVLRRDEEDVYIEVQLAPWQGFWARCWSAFKYVCHGMNAVNWDTVMLDEHAQRRIAEFLGNPEAK